MRRGLPYILALLLGVGAALLAACGSGTKSGIQASAASDLKSQIEDVGQAVDSGRCGEVLGQLKQVDERIDALPPSTDQQLVNTLQSGADKLRQHAIEECDPTPTTDTTTDTTPADTTPTPTTTTDTTATTDTTPTTTDTTATTPPVTVPPPAQPPPPPPVVAPPAPEPAPVTPPQPPVTPGGGTRPEIPQP